MGEKGFEEKAVVKAMGNAVQEMEQSAQELCFSAPGGRFHVRWDENGSASAMSQLAFSAEFLEVAGLFARWVGVMVNKNRTPI